MENKEDIELNIFTLRLPKELDDAVQKSAVAEKRSKNSQIAFILEKYVGKAVEKSETDQLALNK